jgi:large subunit ribosomal protein L6
MPIEIPEGVKVNIQDKKITIWGPNGELDYVLPACIDISKKGNQIILTRCSDENISRSLHGLVRSLIFNMICGVTCGFKKELEISGVGYRVSKKGDNLVLEVGFSHPIEIEPPSGISFQINKNIIIVSGIDKQKVGATAAKIRAVRKPEPYKGKGIKYVGEVIKRKVGKATRVDTEGPG